MYLASVLLLLFVLPAISVVVEAMITGAPWLPLAQKWFVFWPTLRLFIAGIRQVIQPDFTARDIFKIEDPLAAGLVREIGFGNLAMGALGILTLLKPALLFPAALVAGLYYGLAGIGHIPYARGNAKHTIAMVTDLAIAVVLAVIAVRTW